MPRAPKLASFPAIRGALKFYQICSIITGVGLLLLVSAVIEAFVTPSGLPTAARIGIGALAELAFLAYVAHGARLLRAGEHADVAPGGPSASVPVAG